MDFSAAADVPIAKSFDNVIESDTKGNFMVESSNLCFNYCIPKVSSVNLTQDEEKCLKECYLKSYYSFSLVNKE